MNLMKFGICEIGYMPLRAGISHKSEMLSQVLFGEIFEILIQRGDWTKIRLIHDSYEGWVEEQTISHLEIEEANENYLSDMCITNIRCTSLLKNSNQKIKIPIGCVLQTQNPTSKTFQINNNQYDIESELIDFSDKGKRKIIIDNAVQLLGTPYLWGGRTAWGIDCSGFSQLLYRLAGIFLPRDASQQISMGNTLNFLSESQAGDLVFFDNEDGNIIHVGIILENSKIIHASKQIRIDTIDHQGIYNRDIKRYTHNLRVIKSLI